MKRKPQKSGQGKQAQRDSPPSVPPPIEENKNCEGVDSENRRQKNAECADKPPHWTSYIEAACAVLLVVITAFYTHYAYQQAGAAITAAGAAQSAAVTASNSLQTTERPWVSVDAIPIYDLISDTNGAAHIAIRIDYRNSGPTPAIQAKTDAEIIDYASHHPEIEAQSFCKGLIAKAKNSVMSDWVFRQTYFPNVPYSNTWGLEFSPKEQGNSQDHNGFFFPAIIVCSAYQSSFESSWHYSWKIYQVLRKNPAIPGTFSLENGKPIPKDQLIFAPDIYPEGAN